MTVHYVFNSKPVPGTAASTTGGSSRLLVGHLDKRRLDLLLDSPAAELSWEVTYYLAGILDHATLVDQQKVPTDTVTLHSRVQFRDETTGEIQEALLVLPEEEHRYSDAISILTPVGSTLLGMAEGQTRKPGIFSGPRGPLTVLKVLYQPPLNQNTPAA